MPSIKLDALRTSLRANLASCNAWLANAPVPHLDSADPFASLYRPRKFRAAELELSLLGHSQERSSTLLFKLGAQSRWRSWFYPAVHYRLKIICTLENSVTQFIELTQPELVELRKKKNSRWVIILNAEHPSSTQKSPSLSKTKPWWKKIFSNSSVPN